MPSIASAADWAERPVRRITGSTRLNPLPHAGTISVFLLGVVVVSGLYITLFFEFGHTASYEAVAGLEDHPIQRVVRALHRYASAAMVLTTIIHGWRILISGRFAGRRRFARWSTGIASLLLVWGAGVSGYWLVWDVRTQALNEATARLLRFTSWGQRFAVAHLLGIGESSGSVALVVLWFVHVLLTITIGWFVYRHLRRTRLSFLPPRHWMILMGSALIITSIALPLGMLPAASPTALTADMPLDPFVLFLLPPLLSSQPWLAVAGFAALGGGVWMLPKLIERRRPTPTQPVEIDEAACTGCELCVVDCPYQALTMRDVSNITDDETSVAVVDPQSCVSCGICLGSCAFGAMQLPGYEAPHPIDVAERQVLVVCDRHLNTLHDDLPQIDNRDQDDSSDPLIVGVRCAGMLSATTTTEYFQRGAASVQLIGCPPADCRYGVGNAIASARHSGTRAPHLARKWAGVVLEDWVAPNDVATAIRQPGQHPETDPNLLPANRSTLWGAVAVVAASVIATAFATQAPYRADNQKAMVRVVLDHQAGSVLEGQSDAFTRGNQLILAVSIDGEPIISSELQENSEHFVTYIDIPLASDARDQHLRATLQSPAADPVTVFDNTINPQPGTRVLVTIADIPPEPGAAEGEKLFNARETGCSNCHTIDPGRHLVGPSLAGIAVTGADRIEGLDAAGYIRQSILLPDEYVVDGYRSGQMLPIYLERLSPAEIDALIAYLLTLDGPNKDGGS